MIKFSGFKTLFCFLLFLMLFPFSNFSFAVTSNDIINNLDNIENIDNIIDKYLDSSAINRFDLPEIKNSMENTDSKNLIKSFQDSSPIPETESDTEIIENQFIIVLNDNENVNSLEKPSNIMDSILEQNKDINFTSFTILNEFTTGFKGFTIKVFDNKIIDLLRKSPDVKEMVPDMLQRNLVQAHLFHPNNIYVEEQVIPTGIDRIDADLSSTKSGDGRGSVDIDIAIMDTGISLNHPDLNVYRDVTFVPGTTSGDDDNGHGSAVAGLAAAKDNNIGIVGVAPDARLWAIKILNEDNAGSFSSTLQGYEYILQNADEIDVANFSFGGPFNPFFTPLTQTLIEAIYDAGIVMVASAGNNDLFAGGQFFPQAFPETMSTALMFDSDGKCGGDGRPVASTGTLLGGRDDTSRQFLSPTVDIVAPGADILSTSLGNSYMYFSGSSASAPIVSGAAALYLSNHEDDTPEEVFEALQDEGSTKDTKCNGEGRGYLLFEDDPRHKLIQANAGIPERNFPPLLYVGNF